MSGDHALRIVRTRDDAIRPYCGCGWVGEGKNSDYAEKITDEYRAHLPVAAPPPEAARPDVDRFRP